MTSDPDLLFSSVFLRAPSLTWPAGWIKAQVQIKRDQSGQRFRSKDIYNVLSRGLVALGREQCRLLALRRLLTDGKLDPCLDTSILAQLCGDSTPFSFDVPLQLPSPDW